MSIVAANTDSRVITPPPAMLPTPPVTPKASTGWESLIGAGSRYINKIKRHEKNIEVSPLFDTNEEGLVFNLSDVSYKSCPVPLKRPDANEHNTEMACKACDLKFPLAEWKTHKNSEIHVSNLTAMRVNVQKYNKTIQELASKKVLRETSKSLRFDENCNIIEYAKLPGYEVTFVHDFDAELSSKASRLHKLLECSSRVSTVYNKINNRYSMKNTSGVREGIITNSNHIHIPAFWIDGKICSATVSHNCLREQPGTVVEFDLYFSIDGKLVAESVREVKSVKHLFAPGASDHLNISTTPKEDPVIDSLLKTATINKKTICIKHIKNGQCNCKDKSSEHFFIEDTCESSKFSFVGNDVKGAGFTLKSANSGLFKTEFHIVREHRALCYSINSVKRHHFRHFEYDGKQSITIPSLGKKISLPADNSIIVSDLRHMAESMGVTHNLQDFVNKIDVSEPRHRFLEVSCLKTLSHIQRLCPDREIQKAWKVVNNNLELQFRSSIHNMKITRPGIKRQGIIQAFHGTPETNLMGIAKTGFDPTRRCGQAHGPGEYFGKTIDISACYSSGSNFVYVCDIFLGSDEDHAEPPCTDMIILKQHNDWVQAVPRYLIEISDNYHCTQSLFRKQLEGVVEDPLKNSVNFLSESVPVVIASADKNITRVTVKGLHHGVQSDTLALGDMTEFFKNFNITPSSAILIKNICVVTFSSPVCPLLIFAANRTAYRGSYRLQVAAC